MDDLIEDRKHYHQIAYMESMVARLESRLSKATAAGDWDGVREYSQRIDYLRRRLAYELSVGAVA